MRIMATLALRALRVTVRYRASTVAALTRGGCIVTCNHISLVDGIVVALASPVPLVFAVDTDFSRRSRRARLGLAALTWLGFGEVVPMDRSAPFGLRTLARSLGAGKNVAIFPEGVISLTGARAPDRPGCQWLSNQAGAAVLQLQIFGADDSRIFAKYGKRLWPKISLEF
ncbi:1-acyl-sn-glycerol-3-phosphate acyltransferase (plasmid) [Achromobacter sp. CF-sbj1-Ac2-l]|uniref:1-acyl-sn-glycerol-3-phosphate acyltransferase n=1 Tax=Achromobacter sp. CF-sbj1-Ac2-l TaxID=3444091 RepID=UPI0009E7E1D0